LIANQSIQYPKRNQLFPISGKIQKIQYQSTSFFLKSSIKQSNYPATLFQRVEDPMSVKNAFMSFCPEKPELERILE